MAKRKRKVGRPPVKDAHDRLVKLGKISHASKAQNPCQMAWEIYDEHAKRLGANMKRKAAIDAACKAGVAFYTARTQYQQWKQAGDRDRAAAFKRLLVANGFGTQQHR